jgi:HEPN domain-containing protein
MPPERFSPDDPREWLRRAQSNLAQAQSRDAAICLEDLCFQAQQSVEKALKALVISRRNRPPHTHDLGLLLNLIEKSGQSVPREIPRVARLTDYAVETRYPGLFEPVTEDEYRDALALATQCVDWVRSLIG